MCISGTTCATTVLTRAIFTEGCKLVEAGMDAKDLRWGITKAVNAAVSNLKSRARMIRTLEGIAQVLYGIHMHKLSLDQCLRRLCFAVY